MIPWASYQIRKIAGCACARNAGNVFPRRRFQRKLLVSDPGMHHGTCVTHVPWCMSGSLTCGDGENVPGIPGACAPAISRIWQEAHGFIDVSAKNDIYIYDRTTSLLPLPSFTSLLVSLNLYYCFNFSCTTPSPTQCARTWWIDSHRSCPQVSSYQTGKTILNPLPTNLPHNRVWDLRQTCLLRVVFISSLWFTGMYYFFIRRLWEMCVYSIIRYLCQAFWRPVGWWIMIWVPTQKSKRRSILSFGTLPKKCSSLWIISSSWKNYLNFNWPDRY